MADTNNELGRKVNDVEDRVLGWEIDVEETEEGMSRLQFFDVLAEALQKFASLLCETGAGNENNHRKED